MSLGLGVGDNASGSTPTMFGDLTLWGDCRPLITTPLSLNGDYNRDPNIEALKRRGIISQGSTLWSCMSWFLGPLDRRALQLKTPGNFANWASYAADKRLLPQNSSTKSTLNPKP